MGEEQRAPKIDIINDKSKPLKEAQITYMKFIEQKNLERVQNLKIIRRKNWITGSIIGAGVIGIYFYSMFAIKQESFLDDFNEPEITKATQ